MDSSASRTRSVEQLDAQGSAGDPWPRVGVASRTELDPLSFLKRSAALHPARVAVVHGELRRTYEELHARVNRLASALRTRGVGRRDRVAVLSPNTPALLESHFGVPAAGGVLVAINARLRSARFSITRRRGRCWWTQSSRRWSTARPPASRSSASTTPPPPTIRTS